jgi:hypothetical protein
MPAEAEENAFSADAESSERHESPDRAERDAGIAQPFEHGPAAGDRSGTWIGTSSGTWSDALSEPVVVTRPGPASSVLERLSVDVADEAAVERFVDDYLRLLPSRLSKVQRLLSGADLEATRVAILSLETTSAMLGGVDVVLSARALRHAVQSGDHDARHVERLESSVERFRLWLEGQALTA